MAAGDIKFVLYAYGPSMAGAVIFIILFALSAGWHIWTLVKQRTWYFIPFVIGCLFEAVGYVGRAISSSQYPDVTTNPYIIQSVLLLLGPTLFAASIYMILGRLVRLLDADNYALIRPRWLTKFFVLGDVLSFFAQGAGGGLLATSKSQNDVRKGENIILAGLGIQIVFFGFFIVVTAVFHRRINQNPTQKSYSIVAPWRTLLYILYATSLLIMIRSIFRVAQYAAGQESVLQTKEYYLYIFDSIPMILVSILFNWTHPSRVIERRGAKDQTVVVEEAYRMQDETHPSGHK